MWVLMLLLLLLAAQVNASWFAMTPAGQAPPPWWVGGRLLWPYVQGSRMLLPQTGFSMLAVVILAGGSALLFLLAAAALLGWWVSAAWFTPLVVVAAVMSLILQLNYFSAWSAFPALVDLAALWTVLNLHWTVSSLRG